MGPLYAIYSIPHINQVYILFRAQLLEPQVKAGAETLEVNLFAEPDIPWDSLAFATVRNTLTHYFDGSPRRRIQVSHGHHRADAQMKKRRVETTRREPQLLPF